MDGKKFDDGKLPLGRVLEQFPRALEALAKCSKYGHDKYELGDNWQNFRGLDPKRLNDAGVRHQLAHNKGEILDPESKLPHLFHAVWNNMAKLEIQLEKEEKIQNNSDRMINKLDEVCERYNNNCDFDSLDFAEEIMSLMGYR
jgi:hypothetical protein